MTHKDIWTISIDERHGELSIGGIKKVLAKDQKEADYLAFETALDWHREGDGHPATQLSDGWFQGDGPEMWKIDDVSKQGPITIEGVEFRMVRTSDLEYIWDELVALSIDGMKTFRVFVLFVKRVQRILAAILEKETDHATKG